MDLLYLATKLIPDSSVTFTLTVVIAGISIVLVTLMVLIVIFSLFGKALVRAQKKPKSSDKGNTAPQTEKKNEVPPPPPIIEAGIPGEVIAAISAAVYMQDNSGVTIKSIRRKRPEAKSRNAWAQAAVIDNTRPF